MFGRVSTVPLPEYFKEAIFDFSRIQTNFSIGVGKKFNGEWVKSKYAGGTTYIGGHYPKVSGWVDVDSEGEMSFPEYEFPEDLPEWVSTKYVSYEPAIETAGRSIIGVDACIGPLTLNEAIYFFSVTKKFEPEKPVEITASSLGLSVSHDLGESDFGPNIYDFSSWSDTGDVPDEENPRHLFQPHRKNRTVYFVPFYAIDDQTDDDGIGKSLSMESYDSYYGAPYAYYGSDRVRIVVDVDNLSDYYITGFDTIVADVTVFASSYVAEKVPAPTENDPDAFTVERKSGNAKIKSIISIGKFKVLEDNQELSEIGDTVSIVTGFNGEEKLDVKIEECVVTFEYGLSSITIPAYRLTYETVYQGEDTLEPPTIKGLDYTEVKFNVTEFWPYKNAGGMPVYDEDTGAIDNDPLS